MSVIDHIKNNKLSSAVYLLIFIASVIPIPDIKPLKDFNLLDKWVHFVMYGTLSLCAWWDTYRQRPSHVFSFRELKLTTLYPTLFGGLMELVQRYCTFGLRSGDWIDVLANTIGVALGFIFGFFFVRRMSGKKG